MTSDGERVQVRDSVELAEQATERAERFVDALTAISEILSNESLPEKARIMRARTILAGLGTERPGRDGVGDA